MSLDSNNNPAFEELKLRVKAHLEKVYPEQTTRFRHNKIDLLYAEGGYQPPSRSDFIRVKKMLAEAYRTWTKPKKTKKTVKDKKNNVKLVRITDEMSDFLKRDGVMRGYDSEKRLTSHFTNYFILLGLKDPDKKSYINFNDEIVDLFKSGLEKEREYIIERLKTSKNEALKERLSKNTESLEEMSNKRGRYIHLQRWLRPFYPLGSDGRRIKISREDTENYDEIYKKIEQEFNHHSTIKNMRVEITNLNKKINKMKKEKRNFDDGKRNKYDEEKHSAMEEELQSKFKEITLLCDKIGISYNIDRMIDTL